MTRPYRHQIPDKLGRVGVSARLPEDVVKLAWHRAIDEGVGSLSIIVERALRAYFDAHPKVESKQ